MFVAPVFEWTEDQDQIDINVKIKRANISKLHLSICDVNVKLNYEGYFLCLDLEKQVETDAKVVIMDQMINIKLNKCNKGMWGKLCVEKLSKAAIMERRLAASARKEALEEQIRVKKKETKEDVKKHALHTQWSLEHQYKKNIEDAEKSDRVQAENELNTWLDSSSSVKNSKAEIDSDDENVETEQNSTATSTRSSSPIDENKRVSWSTDIKTVHAFDKESAIRPKPKKGKKIKGKDIPSEEPISASPVLQRKSSLKSSSPVSSLVETKTVVPPAEESAKEVFVSNSGGVTIEEYHSDEEKENTQNNNLFESSKESKPATKNIFDPIPIRSTGVISTSFTATATRGPARSSRTDVLPKPIKAPIKNEITEHPAFLKEQGDSLFSKFDFSGAVSAYSAALELDDSYLECLANRSAAYLKLAEMELKSDGLRYVNSIYNCLDDCTKALAKDDSSSFPKRVVKLYRRRAACLVITGESALGLNDLESALKIESSEELIADIQRLQTQMEDFTSNKHVSLKAKADVLYKAHDVKAALPIYTASLLISPSLSVYSNRSACHLVMKNFLAALCDVNIALGLLEKDIQKSEIKLKSLLEKEREFEKKAMDDGLAGVHITTPFHAEIDQTNKKQSERAKLKSRLLSRRGSCNSGLMRLFDAKSDYEEALRLDPHDATLLKDRASVIKLIQNQSSPNVSNNLIAEKSDSQSVFKKSEEKIALSNTENSEKMKESEVCVNKFEIKSEVETSEDLLKSGRLSFSIGKFQEAVDSFSSHIFKYPNSAAGLLNRAACYFALNNFNSCVQDCTMLVNLKEMVDLTNVSAEMCKFRALVRRGSAWAKLGQADESIKDFESALFLSNSSLKDSISKEEKNKVESDLCKIRSAV